MAGVTIRYDADPSDALDGTARVEEALGDLGRSLDDVAGAGAEAGADLGESLGGVGDDAAEAAEGLEDVSDGAGGAGINARSMGSVFKQALEGDVAGAARAAVPLLSALGPAAAIAGVVAFAGLSLIQRAIEDSSGAAEVSSDDAARWARSWIEAGGSVITSQQLVAEVRAIAEDPERYEEAKQNATDWGVTVATAMRAMAGDAAALSAAQSSLADLQETVLPASTQRWIQQRTDSVVANEKLIESTKRGAETMDVLTASMEAGREIAASTSDALLDIVASSGTASLEVDNLGNRLYTLPDSTQVVVDAETGLASQNLETFKGDLDGVPETITTALELDTGPADKKLAAWRRRFTTGDGVRVTIRADLVGKVTP